ncbi:MAG: DNA translocase FtsK 4TM domain-containing protein [Elusimicrobia bacterium]|nr:DNA translocase FtsK 4TM domain-containing protein [Elusimicrobiota bacterium]
MGRKNSRKSSDQPVDVKKKDIQGIALLSLGIILFFAFVLKGNEKYVGAFGALLAGALTDFLGYIRYIIPLIFVLWSFTEFKYKKFPFKYSMIGGFLLILIGGSIFLHVIFGEKGGGLLGDFLSDVIVQSFFGKLGAYIISLATVLISMVIMFNISVKKTVSSVIALLKKLTARKEKPGQEAERTVKKEKPLKKAMPREEKKPATVPLFKKKPETPKPEKKEETPEAPGSASKQSAHGTGYGIPADLLNRQKEVRVKESEEIERGEKLKEALVNFDIVAEISDIKIGPSITRYEITVPPDVKLSRIRNLSSNIAMALKAKTVRLLTPIPGKSAVGVEVPAIQQETVFIRTVIDSQEYRSAGTAVPYCLGKSINGDLKVADITSMPHLLLAGATGSGKSIAIHILINSILFKSSPREVNLLMMDPKRVELPIYNGIPHLAADVITNTESAVKTLQAVTGEMDERYDILSKNNVAEINAYNAKAVKEGWEIMPRLVVIIDELADLMVLAKDKVENAIVRISQMARAVGIHLILATQRPSVDILTGIIKANLPARIAFNVLSGVDSRTILDSQGAEKLLGKGDMLYLSSELPQPERLQGCFISRGEISRVVEHIKSLNLKPTNKVDVASSMTKARSEQDEDFDDDVYPQAVELVIRKKKASISLLQRRLRIGYNRAARIIDKMEDNGIISEDNGVKGREVLVEDSYLDKLK